MKRVPRANARYPLRSREGRGESREHSTPVTATPPAFKVRHPSQLLPGPRISLRLPSSSTANAVAIFQGPLFKLPSIPFY
eukprot:1147154-Pelagomonas_calceolata.AAC.6